MYYDKIAATGISEDRLILFLTKLYKDGYTVKEAVDLGSKDSLAIHSINNLGRAVYLADSFNNNIYKFDITTNELFSTNVGRDPRHMCMDNKNIYVANFESDNISIIDLDSFTLTGSIPAGIKVHDVLYSEKNNSLYTTCYEENEVVEYNINTGLRRNFKTDGKPMHIYVVNDTIITMTYFVNGNVYTKINFIDLNSTKIEDIIIIEGLASDFVLESQYSMLYIINIVDKSIYIADITHRKILKKIFVGGYPESITCGKNNIYVSNSKKQQVDVIEKKGQNLISSIKLQFIPNLIKVIC